MKTFEQWKSWREYAYCCHVPTPQMTQWLRDVYTKERERRIGILNRIYLELSPEDRVKVIEYEKVD